VIAEVGDLKAFMRAFKETDSFDFSNATSLKV